MHDVEHHTTCYLRDLLVTSAHEDPAITSFLAMWAIEELGTARRSAPCSTVTTRSTVASGWSRRGAGWSRSDKTLFTMAAGVECHVASDAVAMT